MGRYIVVGPERTYTEWVCEDGGPKYDIREPFLVDAPNRRAAKWAAWKRAKSTRALWSVDLYRDHPLKGVTVEEAGDCEPSGWDHIDATGSPVAAASDG